MNTLLSRSAKDWRQCGGLDTAEEIAQQPAVWRALADSLAGQQEALAAFLGSWLANPACRVILTGAGSSAYVGGIVADAVAAHWPAQVRALSTTSLLSHPELYLEPAAPTLLVSFARSGNSPESLAAVELVRERVRSARFLHITCNEDGSLARDGRSHINTLNLMMPAASCDRAFAMTSSFTCMLLAALVVFGAGSTSSLEDLAAQGERALAQWTPAVAELARVPVTRIVYLGSGPLEALAREAALKVLELTAGRVLALPETALGFRHGPKAVLNSATRVVMFRSTHALAQRYEQDLLDELRRDGVAGSVLSVGPAATQADFGLPAPSATDAWLAPLWLMWAQLLALHTSVALELRPDQPFADGTVNRVVQGVRIYRDGQD